ETKKSEHHQQHCARADRERRPAEAPQQRTGHGSFGRTRHPGDSVIGMASNRRHLFSTRRDDNAIFGCLAAMLPATCLMNRFDRTVDRMARGCGGDEGDQSDLRQHRPVAQHPHRRDAAQSRKLLAPPPAQTNPASCSPPAVPTKEPLASSASTNSAMALPPPINPPFSPNCRKCRWKCAAMKLSLAPMRCSTSITGRLVAIAARVAKATES